MNSLKQVTLWREIIEKVEKEIPNAPLRIKRCKTISSLIGMLVEDLSTESQKRIENKNILSLEDVRNKGRDLVGFSESIKTKTKEAKAFLYENMYHHKDVVEMSQRGGQMIKDLFKVYINNPELMPEKYSKPIKDSKKIRSVCDYIAGMTDRFAIAEHKKLVDSKVIA